MRHVGLPIDGLGTCSLSFSGGPKAEQKGEKGERRRERSSSLARPRRPRQNFHLICFFPRPAEKKKKEKERREKTDETASGPTSSDVTDWSRRLAVRSSTPRSFSDGEKEGEGRSLPVDGIKVSVTSRTSPFSTFLQEEEEDESPPWVTFCWKSFNMRMTMSPIKRKGKGGKKETIVARGCGGSRA